MPLLGMAIRNMLPTVLVMATGFKLACGQPQSRFNFGAAAQSVLELLSGSSGSPSPSSQSSRPNILFILTDDQDLHMNSLDYVPLIKKHLIDQGTLYRKHFCTTAICCPSRVSIFTGQLAHNTNVTDVFPPYGKGSYALTV